MMEVSLSFAAAAANDNVHLLLLVMCIVALAFAFIRKTTASFVLIGLHKSQTAAVVENVA